MEVLCRANFDLALALLIKLVSVISISILSFLFFLLQVFTVLAHVLSYNLLFLLDSGFGSLFPICLLLEQLTQMVTLVLLLGLTFLKLVVESRGQLHHGLAPHAFVLMFLELRLKSAQTLIILVLVLDQLL